VRTPEQLEALMAHVNILIEKAKELQLPTTLYLLGCIQLDIWCELTGTTVEELMTPLSTDRPHLKN
jgi:hypothetical protein